MNMKKVIVIGCPGSGKSTFSRKLSEITCIPIYHLDMMYWNEDRTTVEKEVFYSRLKDAMEGKTWIIDGNYNSTMEMRLEKCDTVFFLDYPTEVCIQGIFQRRGKPRADMPWTEDENQIDEIFLDFVKKYNLESRPSVLALLEKYSYKKIYVFKTREEGDLFLKEISQK